MLIGYGEAIFWCLPYSIFHRLFMIYNALKMLVKKSTVDYKKISPKSSHIFFNGQHKSIHDCQVSFSSNRIPDFFSVENSRSLLKFNFLDSFLSEPELDLAFNRPHQTIDILSAAGNLQERSGVHGGYGTPSSYASEQEMKLYFDSTPLPDVELESFSGDNFDEMPSDRVEAELHTITALNEKMKNEIVAVEAQGIK